VAVPLSVHLDPVEWRYPPPLSRWLIRTLTVMTLIIGLYLVIAIAMVMEEPVDQPAVVVAALALARLSHLTVN